MKNNLAPVILFVYNRLDHTRQTVEALQKNELAAESTLYVFADGAKEDATDEQREKVQDVRNYIHSITGFKEIIIVEAPKNKGLANSVITGVTKVINKHGKVIVVEDDIVTHPFFLRFMNDCLDVYEKRHDIFMIGGFGRNIKFPLFHKNDVYLVHRSNSWGWSTWKDRWMKADWNVGDYDTMCTDIIAQEKFNRGGFDMFSLLKAQMEGRIDSWAIRWDYCMYKNNAFCVNPVKTFIRNQGLDGSGIHCGRFSTEITAPLYNKKAYSIILPPNIEANKKIEKELQYYLAHWAHLPTLFEKVKSAFFLAVVKK